MKSLLPFVVAIALVACATPGQRDPIDAGIAQSGPSTEELIASARADPTRKPVLARSIVSGRVLVIPDPHASSLALLPVYQNERIFIPVFSSREIFDQEAYGTGFAGKAIVIDGTRFASLLSDDEIVVLNPGHRPAIEFKGSELRAALHP
jgi:hypothetical protein